VTPRGPLISPAIEGESRAISLRAVWLDPAPIDDAADSKLRPGRNGIYQGRQGAGHGDIDADARHGDLEHARDNEGHGAENEAAVVTIKSAGLVAVHHHCIYREFRAWVGDPRPDDEHGPSDRAGFAQGFAIALLNPKILAWFMALYAPFIEADISTETLFGMGLLGMAIDGTWYVTVAILLARGQVVARLRARSGWIDAAMGVLMFVFAGLLFSK